MTKVLDSIEKAVYAFLKPFGFKKHGRTLHRFVSEDISQVITFCLGQAYRGETHLLTVETGIRVPECVNRSFERQDPGKRYYHEYDCNIRSNLGTVEGKKVACYDLRSSVEEITTDILRQIRDYVLPAFEALSDRDRILAHRRDYPCFDQLNRHLILLEEAMIYGYRGEKQKAVDTFCRYYQLSKTGQLAQKDPATIQRHLQYLEELAIKLGITIQPL